MTSSRIPARPRSRTVRPMALQEREPHPVDRQQQQDNGTREFQPRWQQGDSGFHDAACTLEAFLRHDTSHRAGRPPLTLAR